MNLVAPEPVVANRKSCCACSHWWSFFPKQFTVGVLNATLDLAALVLVGVVGFLGSEWSCLPLSPVVSLHVGGGCWCVAAFLGSEVVLSPVVSGCLPSCGGWVLVCGRLLGL